MNTVFARAVVALSLVALPASALASTKATTKHSHSVAKKDAAPKKKGKHHGHKSASKGVAAAPSKAATTAPEESATKAP